LSSLDIINSVNVNTTIDIELKSCSECRIVQYRAYCLKLRRRQSFKPFTSRLLRIATPCTSTSRLSACSFCWSSVGHPRLELPFAPTNTITSLPAIIYNRRRVLPIVAPYLPSRLTARLSNYVPLESTSFADQVRAGMSSSNFDVESANVAEGSGEGRVGLDDAGVEEVRRIMWVAVARG
jgi:hypothetical protein